MGIIDRYIAKQVIGTTLFAIAVLCGVFLLGTVFKEVRPLFLGQNPSYGLVIQFIFNVIPFSLMFTIPWGFLVAVLLTFGRLSSDNELVAIRMSGRSLLRIAFPVLVLGFMLSCISLLLNVDTVPRSKSKLKKTLYELVRSDPNKLLTPGVASTHFKGKMLYIEEREGDLIKGLHIHTKGKGDDLNYPDTYLYAKEAKLFVDRKTNQLRLKLKGARIETADDQSRSMARADALEPLVFNFAEEKKRRLKPNTYTDMEIHQALKAGEIPEDDIPKYRHELSRRHSVAFAPLALALVGIPLGISARRKESSMGFALSMGIAIAYFVLHTLGDEFRNDPGHTADILFWLPNIVALILGSWLFYRARSK